jgi:hypothetical protein
MIKKFTNISAELEKLRNEGLQRGNNTGFKCLDELYSIKPGSYTFVLGPPHSGKTEFCFELLFNQAEMYGRKSLIYSPESGSVEQIYAELIHKRCGKQIFTSLPNHAQDKEYFEAVNWIDEYFDIVDSNEKSFSLDELYKLCGNNHIIFADPYNELSHDMSKFGTRQDLYIEDLIGDMRRFVSKNKKHVILALHPSVQEMTEDKESKKKYYGMATARQAAGGQALFRKAMGWINIWRPPVFLRQEGKNYKDNEVIINVEKAKPKGSATRGTTSLYFNWKTNRYYEDINGMDRYAFQHEKGENVVMPSDFKIPENTNFDNETEDLF